MGVAKWIKGKNGKFLGSIGIGKNTTPTYLPPAPVGFNPSPEALNGVDFLSQSYEQYLANRPTDAQYFEQAVHALENTTDRFGGTVQEKINFKVAAEKYAESEDGQIAVLQKADEYLRAGKINDAADLVDAATRARAIQDIKALGTDKRTANQMLKNYEPNTYDRVETAIAEFRRAAVTPHHVQAFGDQPERTYPFNPIAAGEALSRVASLVEQTRYTGTDYTLPVQLKDVYSEHLVEGARKLAGIRYAAEHPGQPQYVHGDYSTFIDKVERAHAASYGVLRYKIDRQLSAAQQVKNLNSPNFGNELFG